MALEPIRFVMPKMVTPQNRGHTPIREQFLAARVVHLASEMVSRLWPDERAEAIRVGSFAQGKLTLLASTGAAAQELKFQAMSLQSAINRELNDQCVKEIVVRWQGHS